MFVRSGGQVEFYRSVSGNVSLMVYKYAVVVVRQATRRNRDPNGAKFEHNMYYFIININYLEILLKNRI